jgi:hypothetical protein
MAKVNLDKKSKRYLEIGVCCKSMKEYVILLNLIVYIQSYYRNHFSKLKRISLRKLVESAIKDLEKRDKAYYPFS